MRINSKNATTLWSHSSIQSQGLLEAYIYMRIQCNTKKLNNNSKLSRRQLSWTSSEIRFPSSYRMDEIFHQTHSSLKLLSWPSKNFADERMLEPVNLVKPSEFPIIRVILFQERRGNSRARNQRVVARDVICKNRRTRHRMLSSYSSISSTVDVHSLAVIVTTE